jgi:hypothetical protein
MAIDKVTFSKNGVQAHVTGPLVTTFKQPGCGITFRGMMYGICRSVPAAPERPEPDWATRALEEMKRRLQGPPLSPPAPAEESDQTEPRGDS